MTLEAATSRRRFRRPALVGALVLACAILPFVGVPSRWVQLFALLGINVLLAQSMNLLGGYAGQVSLGHAGIYAAGAYGSASLSVKLHWPVWLSIPAGVVVAMAVGLLIALPAERVKEFYLGMVTLGFGFVAYEVLEQWTPVTGGFMGISNIPSPTLYSLKLFGLPVSLSGYYLIVLGLVVLFTWLQGNLIQSYVGRSFTAVEGSELAASTLGIRPGSTKHLAYVVSAVSAGLAGALYGHLVAFISPETFNLWASVSILVMAVFGGLRTTAGPFLGAAFFTFAPELMQAFRDYQLLIYGAILTLSYVFLPKGIAGLLKLRTSFIKGRSSRMAQDPQTPTAAAVLSPERTTAKAPVTSAPLLQLKGIVKDFDGLRALNEVTLSIAPGTIHGLLGPNGSGKSTLINVVTGIYQPTVGEIHFRGQPIQGRQPNETARMGIGRTFQNPHLFAEMTVRENVLTGAHRLFRSGLLACAVNAPSSVKEEARLLRRVDEVIDRVGLTPYRDELAGNLPYGQKRLLDVARCLCADPQLLILDEPAAGLSEAELGQLTRLLVDLRQDGLTILLIEHHLDFLFELVDTVTVLDYGEQIFHGLPAQARQDSRVVEAYLGRYAYAGT